LANLYHSEAKKMAGETTTSHGPKSMAQKIAPHHLKVSIFLQSPEKAPSSPTGKMVGDTGFEPVTSCMSSKHSNHLS
jgi:hypothetical protein